MKKIFALILTVCMVLGAVSAQADTDFSGTWYFLSMGLTIGTFELNADGTCTLDVASGEEEIKYEGTWNAEGNVVTLTIDDQPLPMTYDGTELTVGEEAMALLGGSSIGEMDPSLLGNMMKISREPGWMPSRLKC